MNRSCSKVAGTLLVGMVLAISAYGQSLVELERVPEVGQLFEAAASAQQLRCTIDPVRPALDFGFRFHAGYTADIPLAQFRGSGHNLTVYARVTPEGREPIYMTKTEALPEVPETKVDAVTGGGFVVGKVHTASKYWWKTIFTGTVAARGRFRPGAGAANGN